MINKVTSKDYEYELKRKTTEYKQLTNTNTERKNGNRNAAMANISKKNNEEHDKSCIGCNIL